MSVTQIGRYRVLRELGRGSGAVVYQGRDPASGKQVAIKVFYARLTSAEDFADRFDRTLRRLRTLEHPSLVPVLDYGIETGEAEDAGEVAYYVVSQYMPGGTLAERMDGRPLLLSEVVPILQRLADALDAVHAAGLLHGGLNPEQVLFDIRNRAYLADAGLRGLLQPQPAADALPLPGMPAPVPAGTPAYLSPEQAAGQPADGRADVYALGVILFEMLTGRQPFQAESTDEVLRLHMQAPVPALSETALARLVLPPAFNHVMGRALAKDRDERYPTAGILAEAVRTTFLMAPAEAELPVPPPTAAPPEAAPEQPAEAPASPVTEAGETAPSEPPAAPPDGGEVEPPPAAPTPPARPTVHPVPLSVDPESMSEVVREPEPATRTPLPLRELAGSGIVLILVVLVLWRWSDVRAIFIPPTATATVTVTATATLPATTTPTPPASPTRAASATATTTRTASATVSNTATRTPSRTPTRTPTATSTSTPRPTLPPFTATLAPTATIDPALLPTVTPTETAPPPPPPPSDTPPPPPPSDTLPPLTPTPTTTSTATRTATRTATATSTATSTITPTPAATGT